MNEQINKGGSYPQIFPCQYIRIYHISIIKDVLNGNLVIIIELQLFLNITYFIIGMFEIMQSLKSIGQF